MATLIQKSQQVEASILRQLDGQALWPRAVIKQRAHDRGAFLERHAWTRPVIAPERVPQHTMPVAVAMIGIGAARNEQADDIGMIAHAARPAQWRLSALI